MALQPTGISLPGLQKPRSACGAVASGQAGRSLGQKPRKSTSFCSSSSSAQCWMLLGLSSFCIFPIPWGLERQRPLPFSLLCCLIAGEFKPFHSSVFRLFQVYCPMYAWSADFCHMSPSSTPMEEKRRGKITVQHLMVVSLTQMNSFHFWFFYCLFHSILFMYFSFPVFHSFSSQHTALLSASQRKAAWQLLRAVELDCPGFGSCLSCLLVVWSWTSFWTFWWLSFHICRMVPSWKHVVRIKWVLSALLWKELLNAKCC